MKLVIPCAGKGTRMGGDIPKCLTLINDTSLLIRTTWNWSDVVESYVIVVSPQNENQIREHLREIPNVEYATQPTPAGLADAILQAEKYVKGKFIVNLGDCIFQGYFDKDTARFDLGLGVWNTSDIDEVNKSYLVQESRIVTNVHEKPNIRKDWKDLTLNCGMGVYFLNDRVFNYIRAYRGLSGGGDFTAVIQNMIHAKEKFAPVWFTGDYFNVNTKEDVKKAERILK